MGGNFGHFLPLFPPHLYITLDGTRQDRPNRVAEGGGWAIAPSPPDIGRPVNPIRISQGGGQAYHITTPSYGPVDLK